MEIISASRLIALFSCSRFPRLFQLMALSCLAVMLSVSFSVPSLSLRPLSFPSPLPLRLSLVLPLPVLFLRSLALRFPLSIFPFFLFFSFSLPFSLHFSRFFFSHPRVLNAPSPSLSCSNFYLSPPPFPSPMLWFSPSP